MFLLMPMRAITARVLGFLSGECSKEAHGVGLKVAAPFRDSRRPAAHALPGRCEGLRRYPLSRAPEMVIRCRFGSNFYVGQSRIRMRLKLQAENRSYRWSLLIMGLIRAAIRSSSGGTLRAVCEGRRDSQYPSQFGMILSY